MKKKRLLVVDDEQGVRAALKQIFEFDDFEVRLTVSGGEALTVYPEFRPHVVFLDVKMAGQDGLQTLTRLRDLDPGSVVVMMSGHGTIATALEATRLGAFDFLEKPLDVDRLKVVMRNALGQAALMGENRRLRNEIETRFEMVGASPGLTQVREVIERVSPTTARVLITGENGSGKELVARAIHGASTRHKAAFVEVNCAAIPSELIESELFGHMKGSFTGAVADRPGKFEQADDGTLFLDEVGDMSPPAQAKVLRALQEGVITRVGGSKPVEVDVRVISATNKNLEAEIAAGRFREDLFYRLNVVPIHVPPLRERREDVAELIEHFVRQLAGTATKVSKPFDSGAIARLEQRRWPGNIRELRNAVERLLILSSGKVVTAGDVSRLLGEGVSEDIVDAVANFEGTFEQFKAHSEKRFLSVSLLRHDWKITETAKALDMPRSSLNRRIALYGITRDSQ
jgi:two-component system, NtrC family, nitrogen regulation response regulator NtrX